jgi:hypothetical protein
MLENSLLGNTGSRSHAELAYHFLRAVLDDELRVYVGEEDHTAGPGTVAVLPRRLRHAYVVTSAGRTAGLRCAGRGRRPASDHDPGSAACALESLTSRTSRSSHTRSRSSMPSMRRPGGYPVAGVKASRSTERIRKPCRW